MRKILLVSLLAVASGATFAPGASTAAGCNDEALLNEARASGTVAGQTVAIRLWEDLTCLPAGDGVGGPTDQGHLSITVDGVEVCALDGIDMGNDPFGFGSSVTIDEGAPCGAQLSWSGFSGVYLPSATGPGLAKNAPASGTVWWADGAGAFDDPDATFTKRATLV